MVAGRYILVPLYTNIFLYNIIYNHLHYYRIHYIIFGLNIDFNMTTTATVLKYETNHETFQELIYFFQLSLGAFFNLSRAHETYSIIS